MAAKIRILIADDHRMVRAGLRAFLEPLADFEVVGEAADGREAVALAAQLRPDVLLLDLVMPHLDGVEATRQILAAQPQARILIVTSFADDERALAAVRAGASGYLLKDSSPQELRQAIETLHRGESALPPHLASLVLRALRAPAAPDPAALLTEREREVIGLVAEGLSNQDIADRLTISVWTARTHVTSLLRKLNLENRTQLALFALREGLATLAGEPAADCLVA
jgi:NarL family two-component system response regulator LiaR